MDIYSLLLVFHDDFVLERRLHSMHHQKKLLNGLIKTIWVKLMALDKILKLKIGCYNLKAPPVLAALPVDPLMQSWDQLAIKLNIHLFASASL